MKINSEIMKILKKNIQKIMKIINIQMRIIQNMIKLMKRMKIQKI